MNNTFLTVSLFEKTNELHPRGELKSSLTLMLILDVLAFVPTTVFVFETTFSVFLIVEKLSQVPFSIGVFHRAFARPFVIDPISGIDISVRPCINSVPFLDIVVEVSCILGPVLKDQFTMSTTLIFLP